MSNPIRAFRSGSHVFGVIVLLVSTMMTSVLPAGASVETHDTKKEPTIARIDLIPPASVDEVMSLLEGTGAGYVELISRDRIGDRVYTTGYVTSSGDLSPETYSKAIALTYADIANELERATEDTSGTTSQVVSLRGLSEGIDPFAPRIVAVVVAGMDETSTALLARGTETATNPPGPPIGGPADDSVDLGEFAGTEDAGSGGNCNNAWWPWTGRISTQYSSSVPNRYVWQRFEWSQWRIDNLYDCDGFNTSYEHEAWFNNYDDSLFLSSSVQTWSSTLPDAYLDTGFLDGEGELSLTIGTGAAYQLDADVDYTTYIRTAPGNATTDSGKVNGQRGLNLCPIGLTGGWCVFARETEKLLPAWNHSVPGANNWTHF